MRTFVNKAFHTATTLDWRSKSGYPQGYYEEMGGVMYHKTVHSNQVLDKIQQIRCPSVNNLEELNKQQSTILFNILFNK